MRPLGIVFFICLVLSIWAQSEKDLSQSEENNIVGVKNVDKQGGNFDGGVKGNPSQGNKQNIGEEKNAAGKVGGGQKHDAGGNTANKPGTPNFGQKTNTQNSGQKAGKAQGPPNFGNKPGAPNSGSKTGTPSPDQKQGQPNVVKNSDTLNTGQNQGTFNSGKNQNLENSIKKEENLNADLENSGKNAGTLNADQKIEFPDKVNTNSESEKKVEQDNKEIVEKVELVKTEETGLEQIIKENNENNLENAERHENIGQKENKINSLEINKEKSVQDEDIKDLAKEDEEKAGNQVDSILDKSIEEEKNPQENIFFDSKITKNTLDEKIESIEINNLTNNETENNKDEKFQSGQNFNEDIVIEQVIFQKSEENELNLTGEINELLDEPQVGNDLKPDLNLEIDNTINTDEKLDIHIPEPEPTLSNSAHNDDLTSSMEVSQTEKKNLSVQETLTSDIQPSLTLNLNVGDDFSSPSLQIEDSNQTHSECHEHEHSSDPNLSINKNENLINPPLDTSLSLTEEQKEKEGLLNNEEQVSDKQLYEGKHENFVKNKSEEIQNSYKENIVYKQYIKIHDSTKILIFNFFSKNLANQDLRALFYIILVILIVYTLYHSTGGIEYRISQISNNNSLPGLLKIIDTETEKTKKLIEEKMKIEPTITEEFKLIEDIFDSLQRIQDIEADFKAQVLESHTEIHYIVEARNTPASPARRISIPIPLE